MKYLVMECHTSYAILLDECGCFVKAANLCYQVGQTVEEPVLMREKTAAKKRPASIIISLAAAAACLLLVLMGYHRDYRVSHTSIYLTINPSVCMELNRRGGVIKVTGANEDGMDLLAGYIPSSSDRLTVTNELIERAIMMGYLSEGGQVVIDIDAPDEIHFKRYGVELRSDLAEYLESRLTVEIQIISHDENMTDLLPAEESYEPEKPEPSDTVMPFGEPPSNDTNAVPDSVVAAPNPNKASSVSPSADGKEAGSGSDTNAGKEAGFDGGTDYGEDSYYHGDSDYGKDSDNDTDYEKAAGHDESSDYEKDSGYSGYSDYGGSSDYEKDGSD